MRISDWSSDVCSSDLACELGVARLVPVLTRRTVVDRVKDERLRAHMIEAAEQCGRTAVPELGDPVTLTALLANWPADRALFFADETGGKPALEAMRARVRKSVVKGKSVSVV